MYAALPSSLNTFARSSSGVSGFSGALGFGGGGVVIPDAVVREPQSLRDSVVAALDAMAVA